MNITIHGAWWLRNERLDDAVERVNETLVHLGHLSPFWSEWFFPRPDLSLITESEPSIVGELELIRAKLISSQTPNEDGPAMLDLGYSMTSLSNPKESALEQRSQFKVVCCSQTPSSGYNNIQVRLPSTEIAPALYSPDLLSEVVTAVSEIWDPDWLIARELGMRLTPEPWRPGPALGWVNYLPPRTGVVEGDLPAGWRWFKERGEKQIFVHEGGRPDPRNPEHVTAFKEMFDRIRWQNPPIGVKRS